MRISRIHILKAILEFSDEFLEFVDIINARNQGLQIPLASYINFYENALSGHKDEAVLKNIFSEEALQNAGVFVNIDKHTSTVTLSSVIYNILVWLDVSRKKELDSQPFEAHRQNVVRISNTLMSTNQDSDDFKEAYSYLYEELAAIQSDISENIEVLNYKIRDLSDMSDKREAGDDSISLEQIYQKAQKIYNRNITPFLEFIDPNLKMVGTTNLSDTLKGLERHFRDCGDYEKEKSLQYRTTAIRAYYKDVKVVADKLNLHLMSLSRERDFFLSTQYAFGVLLDSIEPLRHGRMRNKKLTSESEIFQLSDAFDGLKDFGKMYDSKFNFSQEKGFTQFENYFSEVQGKHLPSKDRTILEPVPQTRDIETERAEVIFKIVLSELNGESLESTDNIHRYIWDKLNEKLPDATLIDFLYGLEYFLGDLDDHRIKIQYNARDRINDGKYFLDFAVRKYLSEEAA